MTLTMAVVFAVMSGFTWLRLSRCTSCVPRCPNGHAITIAGNQGMFFVAVTLCLSSVIDAIVRCVQ